jgi:hypothetical protein
MNTSFFYQNSTKSNTTLYYSGVETEVFLNNNQFITFRI